MSDSHLAPAEARALELLINETSAHTDIFSAVPASYRDQLSSALVKLERLARSGLPSHAMPSDGRKPSAECAPAVVDGYAGEITSRGGTAT
jgi:hypothetical protein